MKGNHMTRPTGREFFIPTPTRATVFFRTFFPWQMLRFVWINMKMIRMIGIGHHGRVPLRPIVLFHEELPEQPPKP